MVGSLDDSTYHLFLNLVVMYDEIISDLVKGFAAMLAFAIYKFIEKRKENRLKAASRNNHSPELSIDISREVKHEARKIRDRHQAMRVFVIHFSNGTVNEMGLPLLKISFMHEVVLDYQVQVERISNMFQEVLLPDMFTLPMSAVFKTGEFYLKDIEELSKTNIHQVDYYNWLKAYGVGSSMWLAIYKKGRPAAILVCQWPRPTDLDGTIIARIKDIKRNIEKIYMQIQET